MLRGVSALAIALEVAETEQRLARMRGSQARSWQASDTMMRSAGAATVLSLRSLQCQHAECLSAGGQQAWLLPRTLRAWPIHGWQPSHCDLVWWKGPGGSQRALMASRGLHPHGLTSHRPGLLDHHRVGLGSAHERGAGGQTPSVFSAVQVISWTMNFQQLCAAAAQDRLGARKPLTRLEEWLP